MGQYLSTFRSVPTPTPPTSIVSSSSSPPNENPSDELSKEMKPIIVAGQRYSLATITYHHPTLPRGRFSNQYMRMVIIPENQTGNAAYITNLVNQACLSKSLFMFHTRQPISSISMHISIIEDKMDNGVRRLDVNVANVANVSLGADNDTKNIENIEKIQLFPTPLPPFIQNYGRQVVIQDAWRELASLSVDDATYTNVLLYLSKASGCGNIAKPVIVVDGTNGIYCISEEEWEWVKYLYMDHLLPYVSSCLPCEKDEKKSSKRSDLVMCINKAYNVVC